MVYGIIYIRRLNRGKVCMAFSNTGNHLGGLPEYLRPRLSRQARVLPCRSRTPTLVGSPTVLLYHSSVVGFKLA